MSSIEGIDKIGEQAARIQIEGPETNGTSGEHNEIKTAIADARADLPPREDTVTAMRLPEGTSVLEAMNQAAQEEGLFDGTAYVAVPEIDGQTTDKLVIAFSGSVAYDATDEQGAKMFNDLALGKAVELRVAGFVSNKQGAYKVTATEEEVVTGKATVRVDTLYLLTPERLA